MQRIGVIGGGQLAWMMAGEARKLGLEIIIQTPSKNDPAVATATDVIFAPIDDVAATTELAKRCDVITFENEFIDIPGLLPLVEQGISFRPRLEALEALLDKYNQRAYFQKIGLPVPKYSIPESKDIVSPFSFPLVVKARRYGYDGKGTFIVKDPEELNEVVQHLELSDILLEEYVSFERELAVMAARSHTGEVVIYPVVETQQEAQVCRRVIIPAGVTQAVEKEVEAIANTLLHNLDVVGIFGIELFLTPEGKVLVNEVAPRTHNSGHYTLDACETSQFEMQLRAVAGLPLGSPRIKCQGAVMVNLLGYEHSFDDYAHKQEKLQQLPGAKVHWYGKNESRPGRKLGHVTLLLEDNSPSQAQAMAEKIESIWYT